MVGKKPNNKNKDNKQDLSFDINKIQNFLKNNWTFILIAAIFLFGLTLRSYHIDYPVVGYHNWKSTHYLTEARNFVDNGFFEHGFFVPEYDYPRPTRVASGAHADSFPMISIMVAILFKIFGESLIVARLIGILFNAAGVFGIYLLAKKLSGNEKISLLASFAYANLPLLTFFSHNIQLENPGIFFMIFSAYFFFKWLDDRTASSMIFTAIFVTLTGLSRYNFMIITVPMIIFILKDKIISKEFFQKEYKQLIISLLIVGFFVFYLWYSNSFVVDQLNQEAAVLSTEKLWNPGALNNPNFWPTLNAYMKDNYTVFGFWLICIGGILALLRFKSSNLEIFMNSYLLAIALSFPLMIGKISGHSYHQYMYVIYAVLAMAYGVVVIMSTILNALQPIFKRKYYSEIVFAIVAILVVYFLFNASIESRNRQFDTQFPGLDIAGDYLKNNKMPDDRVIHSGHQAFGLLWHADMKGSRGIPSTVEAFQFQENERNGEWLFIYQWDFNTVFNGELKDHIESNYELKQIGFEQINNQIMPLYFVLKKGGDVDFDSLANYTINKQVQQRAYEYTSGTRVINFINI